MLKCSVCGRPHFPEKQREAVLERVLTEVREYSEFRELLEERMSVCIECKKSVGGVIEGKTLLYSMGEKFF